MTDEHKATLAKLADKFEYDNVYGESLRAAVDAIDTMERQTSDNMALAMLHADNVTLRQKIEELRARLSQSCATCAHADTRDTVDGWCFCAPPMGDKSYPFYGRSMPLRERCSGWTAKD